MNKQVYVSPITRVIKVEVQGSLLAGSGSVDASIEEGKLDNVPDDWE